MDNMKLKWVACEREMIEIRGDCQRLAKTAGPGAQLHGVGDAAALLHDVNAGLWLETANKNGATDPADKIETPVNAVGAVYIGASRRSEHGSVSRRRPIEAV